MARNDESRSIATRFSASSAGDVNGDGYSDVMVGTPYYDDGMVYQGRGYVFHGSASGPSLRANWIGRADKDSAYFDFSVSTAGDVNGDGYADVIVGAYRHDNGQSDEGRVYVYYGSALELAAIESWTAELNQEGAAFGACVSAAGDVNGDGYSDVIMGAYLYDNVESNEGAAFVYYGNGGTGLRSNARQYRADLTTPVAPGGACEPDGRAGLALYGKSFLGRQKGRLVWEYMDEGVPFSGVPVSSSVTYTGRGSSYTDLEAAGLELKEEITGIAPRHTYRWRARVQYDPVTMLTGQVYGPWRWMPLDGETESGFRCGNMSTRIAFNTTPSTMPSPANHAILGFGRTANGGGLIRYVLSRESDVSLRVFDMMGKTVASAMAPGQATGCMRLFCPGCPRAKACCW